MRRLGAILAASALIALTAADATAQEMGSGRGMGPAQERGPGAGGNYGMGPGMQGDPYGPLMTPEERDAMHEQMRQAQTQQERDEIRNSWHEQMQQRTRERGIEMPPGRGPR